MRRSVARSSRRSVMMRRMGVQHRAAAVALPQVAVGAEASIPQGWGLGMEDDDDGG